MVRDDDSYVNTTWFDGDFDDGSGFMLPVSVYVPDGEEQTVYFEGADFDLRLNENLGKMWTIHTFLALVGVTDQVQRQLTIRMYLDTMRFASRTGARRRSVCGADIWFRYGEPHRSSQPARQHRRPTPGGCT